MHLLRSSNRIAERRRDAIHFSLNVANLKRSVEFYEILFNVAPPSFMKTTQSSNWLNRPSSFSLVPLRQPHRVRLSPPGFASFQSRRGACGCRATAGGRFTDSLPRWNRCGWALQDKVWVADPDQNFWEIYVVHEEIEPSSCRPMRKPSSKVDAADLRLSNIVDSVADASNIGEWEAGRGGAVQAGAREQKILEHRVTDGFSCTLNEADESVDHFRLTGTFNAALSDNERHELLREAFRVLRYGGEVSVHGLVSNLPAPPFPQLPGVASLVKRIPLEHEPISELKAVGFEQIVLVKLQKIRPSFKVMCRCEKSN